MDISIICDEACIVLDYPVSEINDVDNPSAWVCRKVRHMWADKGFRAILEVFDKE